MALRTNVVTPNAQKPKAQRGRAPVIGGRRPGPDVRSVRLAVNPRPKTGGPALDTASTGAPGMNMDSLGFAQSRPIHVNFGRTRPWIAKRNPTPVWPAVAERAGHLHQRGAAILSPLDGPCQPAGALSHLVTHLPGATSADPGPAQAKRLT